MRIDLKLIPVLLFLLCFQMQAGAQDTRAHEERKARLEREIAIIDKQLAENASKSSSMLSDLTLVRKKISNRKALLDDADKKIRSYDDSIYLAQREINRLQARVDTLTANYSRLVLSAYKNRDTRIWYMYMFASENLGHIESMAAHADLGVRSGDDPVEIELAGEYRSFCLLAILTRRTPVVFSDLELGIGRQFFTGGHRQAKAHALASVFRILPRESFGSSLELIQPFAIHLDIDSVSRNRGSRRKRGRQGKSHDVLHTTFP